MTKPTNSIDGIKRKKKNSNSIDGIKTKKKKPENSPNPESLISDMVKPAEIAKEEILEDELQEETESQISKEDLANAFTDKKAEKSDKKEPKTAKKVICRILKYLLLTVELGSAVILLFNVFKANVLNTLYLSIIAAVIVLLFAFTTFKLIRKKTKTPMRVICIILSIILSAGYIVGTVYLSKTISFLEKITTQKEYATESYSILVLKSSEYKDIQDLKDKNIAFIETNAHAELAKSKLSETINFNPTDEQNLGTIITSLTANSVDAIVLSDAHLGIVQDEQKEIYNSIEIIFTFTIEFKLENASNDINIANEPFILYISGNDTRGALSDLGRSDVNMLVVINPETGKILLVSIPRDYYVQLHGTTGIKDKLTHAGIYGTEMSRMTLEDLLGIKIDYTAKVGFNTVIKVVDAIDGVDIDSDTAFTAWTDQGCHITTGIQHLDGRCALAFARERYSYASGDRHRGENQQAVLTAIFEKITKPEYLIGYPNILAALENDFITTFTYNQITEFAKKQLDTLKKWDIESISVDGTGSMQPTYSMGDQLLYVMIPNESTIATAKEKINAVLNPEAQVVEGASEVKNPEPVQE